MMITFHPFFASTLPLVLTDVAEGTDYRRFIWVSLALLVLVIVGLILVTQVKRRLQQDDAPISAGFTLSDLRQMHKSGQMSDEEFEKAKSLVVGAAKRAAEREEERRNAGKEPVAKQSKPPTPGA